MDMDVPVSVKALMGTKNIPILFVPAAVSAAALLHGSK